MYPDRLNSVDFRNNESAAIHLSEGMLPGFELTGEDVKAARDKKLEEGLKARRGNDEDVKYSMIMPTPALNRALQTNQFKNMFQQGNIGSVAWSGVREEERQVPESKKVDTIKNTVYGYTRREAENELFGIPMEAKGAERPVYGFMRPTEVNASDSKIKNVYGDALVDIKKPTNPRANVTATRGDSLNRYIDAHDEDYRYYDEEDGDAPNAVDRLVHEDTKHHSEFTPNEALYQYRKPDYIELQWHRGSKPKPQSDIEHVHLTENINKRYPKTGKVPVVNGVLQKDAIESMHDKHHEVANELRNSGLNAPVTSHIDYSYREPALFDNLPEAERNNWLGDVKHETSRREV
jgi:hypothetical protein